MFIKILLASRSIECQLKTGPCHLGVCITPQRKVKKGGPTCGKGALESPVNLVFEKFFGTTPLPPSPVFCGKIFWFLEIFFWGGAQIFYFTPPNQKPLGTALVEEYCRWKLSSGNFIQDRPSSIQYITILVKCLTRLAISIPARDLTLHISFLFLVRSKII